MMGLAPFCVDTGSDAGFISGIEDAELNDRPPFNHLSQKVSQGRKINMCILLENTHKGVNIVSNKSANAPSVLINSITL